MMHGTGYFANSVKMYGQEHFPDHFLSDMQVMYQTLMELNTGKDSWFSKLDKDSPEYRLYFMMAEMFYFLGDLQEVPKVHRKFKQCYNIWHEEPQNFLDVYNLISDADWDKR